mmetsp:Transcript_34864/g.80631  ORF Transcript_34864/g.80631 Transcript_34864/m.80631 type:complete len:83 (+) Transcript_34864:340-588(+)
MIEHDMNNAMEKIIASKQLQDHTTIATFPFLCNGRCSDNILDACGKYNKATYSHLLIDEGQGQSVKRVLCEARHEKQLLNLP